MIAMPYTVTLEPGGRNYAVDQDTTLLQGALDAEILVPYGCRDGACGACKAKVEAGEVEHDQSPLTTLSLEERAQGMALMCCARARSDLALRCREVRSAHDIPVRKMPCRVQSLEKLAPEVMLLKLRLPAGETFQFLPGQYIDFLLADGQRRSFSIANAPNEENTLELHVRLIPGGHFTSHIFSAMKERDILRFEGPLGSFFLRHGPQEATRPLVFLASGTGFAPIKAILEDMIARGIQRPVALYRGARDLAQLYLRDLPAHWQQLHDFRYVQVLSGLPPEGWSGRRGRLPQAVMEDMPDLSGCDVYACGSPAMIETAKKDFSERCGLPLSSFYADAFTFSSVPQS